MNFGRYFLKVHQNHLDDIFLKNMHNGEKYCPNCKILPYLAALKLNDLNDFDQQEKNPKAQLEKCPDGGSAEKAHLQCDQMFCEKMRPKWSLSK
jgi:hypothetical protein